MNNNRQILTLEEISTIEQKFYDFLMDEMQKEKTVAYIPVDEYLKTGKGERFTAIYNISLSKNDHMFPAFIQACLDPSEFLLKYNPDAWTGSNVIEIYNNTTEQVLSKLKDIVRQEFIKAEVTGSNVPDNFYNDINFKGELVTIKMVNMRPFMQKFLDNLENINKTY